MEQVRTLWTNLDGRRQAIVIGAAVAIVAALVVLTRLASQPQLALLYSGLDDQAAGEVISALEQSGAAFEARGDAIYVAADRRDSLRMTLARDGLPGNGAQGYEILDNLSGFGTTSQMFDAAFWRAKEGELARTIISHPQIESARVHLSRRQEGPFRRNAEPAASVTVTARSGAVQPEHADALRSLVASAVGGLTPANVSVIDGRLGRLVDGSGPGGGSAHRRAEAMERAVERLLAARVGPGRSVVEVSLETVTESEQIRERRIDPDSRTAISEDNEERSASSTESGGDGVTVASNLPDGDAEQEDGQTSRSTDSETRARINYEVSETQREVVRGPGDIRRMTVAVLVDGLRTTGAGGEVEWAPRPEEELEALRELVASAVGLDAERGDSLTLKTMEFAAGPEDGVLASAASPFGPVDMGTIIQLALLGLVIVVLGLFVLRPILMNGAPKAEAPPALPNADGADDELALGDIGGGEPLSADELQAMMGGPMMSDDAGGDAGDADPSDAVDRLRKMIGDRQDETLQILRGWMEERESRA